MCGTIIFLGRTAPPLKIAIVVASSLKQPFLASFVLVRKIFTKLTFYHGAAVSLCKGGVEVWSFLNLCEIFFLSHKPKAV